MKNYAKSMKKITCSNYYTTWNSLETLIIFHLFTYVLRIFLRNVLEIQLSSVAKKIYINNEFSKDFSDVSNENLASMPTIIV